MNGAIEKNFVCEFMEEKMCGHSRGSAIFKIIKIR